MGAADLCPRVSGDRARRGCAGRLSGDLPPRLPRAAWLQGSGEVLVVAVSHRAESVPRLDPPAASRAGGADARGVRAGRSAGGTRAGEIDRGSRWPPPAERGRRGSDGAAAGRAAHGDKPEGGPRHDVPGDCRHAGVPVEHGEDPVVSGAHGAAAASREERAVNAATGETIMSETFTCGDYGALVSYLYDECAPPARRTISAHVAICAACAEELTALGATREQLAMWTPPDAQLGFRIVSDAPPATVR